MSGQYASVQDLRGLYHRISNWGRWGDEDGLGTLNLVTPAKRLAALKAITQGVSVSCARTIVTESSEFVLNAATLLMLNAGDIAPEQGYGHARDRFAVSPHGAFHTHLDALSHAFFDQHMYNGRAAGQVSSAGAAANDLMPLANGVVTKGVLLDIPMLRGVDYVPQERPVSRSELDEAERAAGAALSPGDAVLIRLGRDVRLAQEGPGCERRDGRPVLPGLMVECLEWLRERDVAIMVSDAAHDQIPNDTEVSSPIHAGALVYLGLHLIDNAPLEELAAACRARASWEFGFVVAPLRLARSTGCVVNPLALL